ncbi:hypothetical protein [Flexithrix dorotheae]|uniref:hypothetical protein n=1 Tax=Flexithrix dorotheae TaxID=70993 RepID=UPI0012F76116|nr:hypothetical protein [Flexithrix dorotheae]
MKDIFTGQSIFKKLLGLKVVYKKTQQPVQPLISIFRNFLALPLFPIEIIALLFFGVRISDRIFKTEVVVADRMKIVSIYKELREYKTTAYIRDYLLSFILAILGANIYGTFLVIFLF